MKTDKKIKDLIKMIKNGCVEDENLEKEVIATILEEILEIKKLFNKQLCKCKTDPTKLKKDDILIGGMK